LTEHGLGKKLSCVIEKESTMCAMRSRFTRASVGVAVVIVALGIISTCVLYAKDEAVDPMKETKWGPKLSAEEVAAISQLPVDKLSEMVLKGETMHALEAVSCLKKDKGWRDNLDVLLGLAEQKYGDLIVEGMITSAQVTDDPADRAAVDRFLTFLEKQLTLDKPSVTHSQAIRSMAWAVRFRPVEKLRPLLSSGERPEPPVPYGLPRVFGTVTSQLENTDWRVRQTAIRWLGELGTCPQFIAPAKAALESPTLKKEVAGNAEAT
jgi:hypothetical protein